MSTEMSELDELILASLEEESNNARSETRDNTAHLKLIDGLVKLLEKEEQ